MEVWPWAFIISIKFINLRNTFKSNLERPEYNKTKIYYKQLPVFIPKINPQNSKVFC